MARLTLHFLGPPRVVLDGQDIHIGRRKALALLTYLAVTKQPHSRDALAALLWPENDQSHALGYLRRVLSDLNTSLDKVGLLIDRETAALDQTTVWMDVDAFHQKLAAGRACAHPVSAVCATCVPRLDEAIALYQDDFLAGFSLRDSATFDEWQFFQAEGLRQELATTLERLVDWYGLQGKSAYDQAIAYARRWLVLDTLHEPAHRSLMTLYAQSGQKQAALRQYERCVQILADELGLTPAPETAALSARIRAGELPLPSQQVAQPPAAPVTVFPTPEAVTPDLTDIPAFKDERRLITLVLADVKGSTALLEHVGDETWADIMRGALQVLATEVTRLGGEVEQMRATGLRAVFGAAEIHEDDPERAILAALAMGTAFDAYCTSLTATTDPLDLHLQVGVHTGEAIVTVEHEPGNAPHFTLMGEALLLAERIQSNVKRETLWVSENTYRLVTSLFAWASPDGKTVVAGEQYVTTYHPLAHHTPSDKGRGIAGLFSPLVGRDREFHALEEAVERVCAGLGGIVTVVGEAGIGKSRLVAELRKSPNLQSLNLQWIEGRCLSYNTNTAYQLWVDALRIWLDATPDTAPDAVAQTLRARVQALCPETFNDVYPFLARMLSLPLDDAATARLQGLAPGGLPVLTFRAVETLLERATQQAPWIIVCEDLHWADPTSLALLEQLLPLVDRSALLLICVFRPEREHACWHIYERALREYAHRHTDVRLDALSTDESRQLLDNLLVIQTLPPDLQARILERAEGNPFYTEEVLRTLINAGSIVYDDATMRWQAGREDPEHALPDTLQGLLLARIDLLPPGAKRVLQFASVIGRIFSYTSLAANLTSANLDAHLVTLQRAQLIRERARLPEREYIFQHQLTLEAAYSSLLRRARRSLHRRVAETLERLYPDRIEENLGTLAQHWEEAGETQVAARYWQRAGEQAAAQYANAEAAQYFSRALARLPEDDLETRYRVLLAREKVYSLLGRRAEQYADLMTLQTLSQTMDNETHQAMVLLRLAQYAKETADTSLAPILQDLASLNVATFDAHEAAQIYLEWAEVVWYDERSVTKERLDKALGLARLTGQRDIEAKALRNYGLSYFFYGGDYTEALSYLEQGLQICREIGNRHIEGIISGTLAAIYKLMGKYAESQYYDERSVLLCHESGDRYHEAYARRGLGDSFYRQGDYTEALRQWKHALKISRDGHCIEQIYYHLILIQRAFTDRGHYTEALAYDQQLLSEARETGERFLEWWLLKVMVSLCNDLGDISSAWDFIQQVKEINSIMGIKDSEIGISLYKSTGDILKSSGEFERACQMYQVPLQRLRSQTQRPGTKADSMWLLVGLAQATLFKRGPDSRSQALVYAEELLAYWEENPNLHRYTVYYNHYEFAWTCYIVLRANQDSRADDVLERTYTLLQDHAAKIQDPADHRDFLENVALHRDIIAEWERLHPSA
ncbi:MAG: AAA family ATPase [Anaerolineae bacterium]|nr:AAA family ATPase [Anaerolineae bacterium]